MAEHWDTLVIGAGAAGMMCAAEAAAKGGRVLVIDHAKAPGEKIRISGGGRCNFTNLHAAPENFLSANPHFCKSALSRYTQWDFLDLVNRYGIAWHEKTLGQLFCDNSAKGIIAMLRTEMDKAGAVLRLNTSVEDVARRDDGFDVQLQTGTARCRNLVIATGGKSIPKMGATGFAYRVAEQFNLAVTETRPALVPFTLDRDQLQATSRLSGVSVPVTARAGGAAFDEAILFTHRGLSGPAALQISSYWREGETISLHVQPDRNLGADLRDRRTHDGRRQVATVLAEILPKRLAEHVCSLNGFTGRVGDLSDVRIDEIESALTNWQIRPHGTEGYRTAEVTLGGIDTDGLSSRTMQAKSVPGLYFIGEAVDVTGWLGGYNFQWAWSSGWAAGTAIAG